MKNWRSSKGDWDSQNTNGMPTNPRSDLPQDNHLKQPPAAIWFTSRGFLADGGEACLLLTLAASSQRTA